MVVEAFRVLLGNNVGDKLGESFGEGILGNILRGTVRSAAYFLVICGSYLLMLAVMTYSTGVFVMVCIGSSAGYMIAKAFEMPVVTEQNSYSLHMIKS